MHDGMPYGRNQGQGQGHSREVDRQSPTGLIFFKFTPLADLEAPWSGSDFGFNTTVVNCGHSSLTQPSVLLVSTSLGICGPHWTDVELVRVDVLQISSGATRPHKTRHAYVETHDRQWIIS